MLNLFVILTAILGARPGVDQGQTAITGNHQTNTRKLQICEYWLPDTGYRDLLLVIPVKQLKYKRIACPGEIEGEILQSARLFGY